MNINDYTITEHRHRYAAWAASRAAGVSPLCRFTISVGQRVIDKSGLKSIALSIDNLPRPNDLIRVVKSVVIPILTIYGMEGFVRI
jgi:hypothetical protein